MSILYLHIGGPKTGSTFIQSVLRTNRSTLLDFGIHYPTGQDYPDSTPTSWTSGNGAGILESPEAFTKALDVIKHHPGSSLIYSYEGLRNDVCMAEKASFIPYQKSVIRISEKPSEMNINTKTPMRFDVPAKQSSSTI